MPSPWDRISYLGSNIFMSLQVLKFDHKDNYYIPLYQNLALSLTTLIYIVKNKNFLHKKRGECITHSPLTLTWHKLSLQSTHLIFQFVYIIECLQHRLMPTLLSLINRLQVHQALCKDSPTLINS